MRIKSPEYKYNNVLLIDDSPLDNFINEKLIESAHFSRHIQITTSGQAALDYVTGLINLTAKKEEIHLDCMFVDLNMPLMGGLDFISIFKMIKNTDRLKCRIVILTSSIAREDRLRSEKMDPEFTFINKPLTIEFLNSL